MGRLGIKLKEGVHTEITEVRRRVTEFRKCAAREAYLDNSAALHLLSAISV
jgi:hypothetical protein